MKELLSTYWPELIAAFVGFVVSFLLYLKSRFTLKKQVAEKETENIKLQQLIAAGSYVICPECGHKILLSSVKILTGGLIDEKK